MSFKACQYAMNDDRISMDLRQVSMKDAQISLQKKLFGQKNPWWGGNNGKKHVLRVGYHFGN